MKTTQDKLTSKNGTTWERVHVKGKPYGTYYLVNGVRFEWYHESISAFKQMANPKRYTRRKR